MRNIVFEAGADKLELRSFLPELPSYPTIPGGFIQFR